MNEYKFKREEAKHIFLTSDTHFCHENILKYCQRPFETVEEMNDALVDNWNHTVSDDDIVFHLGDFCFGGIEKWQRIRERLNENIVLILGNHDRIYLKTESASMKVEDLFDMISGEIVVSVGKRNIILNYCPLLCYGGASDNRIYQAYGHVHLRPGKDRSYDTARIAITYPCQYDVGVDLNNFRPISYEEFEEKIHKQIQANKNALMWL